MNLFANKGSMVRIESWDRDWPSWESAGGTDHVLDESWGCNLLNTSSFVTGNSKCPRNASFCTSIHSLHNYFLSTYCSPPIVGDWDQAVHKTIKILTFVKLTFEQQIVDNKQRLHCGLVGWATICDASIPYEYSFGSQLYHSDPVPTNVPKCLGVLLSYGKPRWSSRLLISTWPNSDLCSHLGS